jgi:hypothetical protein
MNIDFKVRCYGCKQSFLLGEMRRTFYDTPDFLLCSACYSNPSQDDGLFGLHVKFMREYRDANGCCKFSMRGAFKILGTSQGYCCLAAIPNSIKCEIDWLEDFVTRMQDDCPSCFKPMKNHQNAMYCEPCREEALERRT